MGRTIIISQGCGGSLCHSDGGSPLFGEPISTQLSTFVSSFVFSEQIVHTVADGLQLSPTVRGVYSGNPYPFGIDPVICFPLVLVHPSGVHMKDFLESLWEQPQSIFHRLLEDAGNGHGCSKGRG